MDETAMVRRVDREDVCNAMLRARKEFVGRLRSCYPDAGCAMREQIDPMVDLWWPVHRLSGHPSLLRVR